MKLKADRATLMKALAHVQSVVERRNTIPILANVMIAVKDGKLTLTATDMEIAIVEDVPATSIRKATPLCTGWRARGSNSSIPSRRRRRSSPSRWRASCAWWST